MPEHNDTSLDKVAELAVTFRAAIPPALYDELVKDLNNLERAALTAAINSHIEIDLIRAFRRMEDAKYGPPTRQAGGYGSPFKPFNRPRTTDE